MTSALNRSMTEDELSQAIIEAATYRGWRVHHIRRSDKAVQQGHSGFPDLVLARNGKVLFFELKSEKGNLSADQIAWLNAIDGGIQKVSFWIHGDVFAATIRPADLDTALRLLQ